MKLKKIVSIIALSLLTLGGNIATAQIRPGRGHDQHQEHDNRPTRPQITIVEDGAEARLFLPHYIAELPGLSVKYECNSEYMYIVRSDRRECLIRAKKPTQVTQVYCKYKFQEEGEPKGKPITHEDTFVFYVEILQVHPENISLNAYTEVGWDCSYTPQPVLYPEHASCGLNWWTENPDVATVNTYGRITGHSLGETRVYVETSNGLQASSLVRVVIPECTSVDFEDTDDLERIDGTHQFHPKAKPERTETTFRWESSDPSVIEIDPVEGIARAKSPGKATITLWSENGKKETRKFKVKK